MKILYGLPSEGMGHATRSRVVISHLLKEHDVRIVTSDRAYTMMKQHFGDRVHQIRGFHFAYKDGRVSKSKSISQLIKKAPGDFVENFKKYGEIHSLFDPDIVISDFESFTQLFAKFYRKPLLSLDNIQVIDRCKLDITVPPEEKNSYIITKNVVKTKVPLGTYYLITSFFKAPVIKKNTALIPSILRDEIINAVPTQGNHIVVYQTSNSQKNMVAALNASPQEHFLLYGVNRDETQGNVTLKSFSEEGFIHDLASAKAVITNGGFSLISEAVYLKKPVCSVPIKNQFEQYINAAFIEKLGYGRLFNAFSADAIKAFLYDLPLFNEKVSIYKQDGNRETFEKIDRILKDIVRN